MENQKIIIKSQKNPGTAAILGFFFGPIGMLYATLSGAIIMFVITAIAVIFTFGFGLIITNPICAIWAYLKVKKDNDSEDINIKKPTNSENQNN